ncbi:hypothetical protein L484_009050 [Morus notabilis]|uniref:Uncharacterized protein n=1 Tax=Morus notabilis TaxID=981085 RepID=W9RB66_9ROSA|nr:scarecrow-like protein 15 [Morus notabilis]EXB80596.1 hypothetical protein L484_009050 [Morus notabilis]
MIVPVTSPQNNPNPKSDNLNNNGNNNNNNNSTTAANIIGFHSPTHIPNLCYEPTSVLDLRRSPSPVGGKPAQPNDSLEWEEQFHYLDWDSLMRELGLHDDSAPAFKTATTNTTNSFAHQLNPNCDPHIIPHFSELISHHQPFDPTQLVHHHHHNLNFSEINLGDHNLNLFDTTSSGEFHNRGNINVGFDFVEDLIRVADCFDSDNSQLAQAILDRLNQRLRSNTSPVGKPVGRALQRAALYFKDALQSLLSGSNRTARLSSWSEIVQTIRAYKAFSGISPIPMFSHFTTNQALLEALNGSAFIHVVDFDIGLGGQYASLMKELAEKSESLRLSPPVVRITAIVPEEYAVESRLIRENLSQFAQDLKIRFQIEFVLFRTFEVLSFKAIKFMEGEKTAVLLSTAALRRLSVAGFLTDVRRISPAVVVLVDAEGLGEEVGATTSFRRSFVCGLEFYSMVMESLDAAMVGGDWVRKIETFVLRPRMAAAVEAAAGRKTAPFREMFHGAGMRPVLLSQFADFQAECLLGKVQVRGFHVAKRQAELVLCWHDRALVATSVWRC